ncbi:DNA adenine methylase [Cuniculiplasma sp. SKW4]|uniref:DNA adenine methylase n=1 Tax=Cuniculiplasma sp. SKW4 TaxID=3400171 RepID=UPI003FD091B1
MEYLRLMKYPGAKKVMTGEIGEIYSKSGVSNFIDVFGGSGSVSLNIQSRYTVYNDLNEDLYNLFICVQRRPENVYFLLKEGVKTRRKLLDDHDLSKNQIDKEMVFEVKRIGKEHGIPEKDVNSVLFLIRMNLYFGGMGNTYPTRKEKASMAYISKTLDQLQDITSKVKKWKIENLDFRQVVEKYDHSNAFFYFDPPYPGADWYDMNFDSVDFQDLANILSNMKGRYLLTIDPDSSNLLEIFGMPGYIKEFKNENGPPDGLTNAPRKRAFYIKI